jgi:membrane-associated phospholipid phosphatase
MMYATFNLGASVYWLVPTAPPWWPAAAEAGGLDGGEAVRRMMVEYGEDFWKDGWGSLYSVFGGNPLAAMPSLHFATSLMAALLLAEVGPIPGALGFAYTATLGFALVYLGEHYVVDLLAGAALTVAVRRFGPAAGGAIDRFGRAVAALEARAHQDS